MLMTVPNISLDQRKCRPDRIFTMITKDNVTHPTCESHYDDRSRFDLFFSIQSSPEVSQQVLTAPQFATCLLSDTAALRSLIVNLSSNQLFDVFELLARDQALVDNIIQGCCYQSVDNCQQVYCKVMRSLFHLQIKTSNLTTAADDLASYRCDLQP